MLATLRHADELSACPLVGVNRKLSALNENGAHDPKRTWIRVIARV